VVGYLATGGYQSGQIVCFSIPLVQELTFERLKVWIFMRKNSMG
jgi:hypothetical protein